MKPINEKERTLAFVQFLVLFILTVILTIFFVFFDTKIAKKDYEELKADNKQLKLNSKIFADLPAQIDSLHTVVMGYKKLGETEYKDQSETFIKELKLNWGSEKSDTSEAGKIKIEMYKVFKDWTFNVGASIREESKNATIKELQEEIKQKDKDYKELDEDFSNYKNTHL